jgi:hypothetical protein
MAETINYVGNIDLDNRKVLKNKDGSISTEKSISFSPDGITEILIPTIVDGKEVSQKQAINAFYKTGEHLGIFNNTDPNFSYDNLEKYAIGIHERQAKHYTNKYKTNNIKSR